MTHDKNNLSFRQDSDSEQIDLIDLLTQIWRGKWIIILFVVLSLIIAGIYLATAKEKWTSVAVVSSPDASQIASYTSAISVLSNDNKFDTTGTQQRVIGRFSTAFSALVETLRNLQIPEKLTIDPAVQGQELPLKVTYQASSAREAQQKLAEYIEQIDQQISKELVDDLDINIKARATDLLESLATQEKVAQEQKDLRIKQISQALAVAKEAEVHSPQVQQTDNVSQDTMFLLGSAALESMIKNESSRPLVFSDDYYRDRKNLLDIQGLKVLPQEIHAYRYVMKPTLPIHRDSPRKILTVALALFLGVLLGSGVVLLRNAVRNYQPKA
ncbi:MULTISPECIES: LPS O-antigen chain length determinant protein WzzB [Kosakonia]|uniref:LPS O-antigen chain length determinant protein WzzB n=1 Tax=Kosakonia TaxID=1330547 RepID=UPI000F6108E6|nr:MULTISPECIES: LPS O-antigen chain length determinant protein WzzB [Kosakonia]AZI87031.1 LPS O-antigen chain length determinant protein WzzB [Kosakonia sp. CCTCC M2018092]